MNIFAVEVEEKFELFSTEHIVSMIILVVVWTLTVLIMRNIKKEKVHNTFRIFLAVLLIAQEISRVLWYILTDNFTPGLSLPLHLCGVAAILSGIMLITKNYNLYEIIYFWGLAGATQALITPSTKYPFPHFEFLQTIVAHGGIILAVFYMTFVYNYRPKPLSILKTIVVTLIYMGLMFVFNSFTGGNYLFVNRLPRNDSIIHILAEIFGPHPYYLIGLVLLGAVSILVLYSPFAVSDLIVKIKKKYGETSVDTKNINTEKYV